MDYSVKYGKKFAERFRKASVTDASAGHDYEFTGAKAVRVYTMTPAELKDYDRGGTRFGEVTDLETTSQEMICTQEKSFTKHLEALDNSDIAPDATAGTFIRMEIDEVITPTMDKYRLKRWTMGAATLKQMTSAPTKSTIVGDIMDLKGDMGDNLVPDTNLTLYIAGNYYTMLKQADALDGLEGMGTNALEKGVVSTFDGMKVVKVPKTWLPAGVYFMIKAKGTSADPVKIAKYDVIEKAVGFSGPVVQGLCYYDAFVVGAKNKGIGVCGANTAVLNAPTLAIANHKVTATAVTGVTFYVTTDGSDPRCSTTRQVLDAGGIVLTEGQTARVVGEKDGCVGIEGAKAYE